MAASAPSLAFKVHRREPELLLPAKATPHEIKCLSDIDDQDGFRFHQRGILVYPNNPSMRGKDPVKIIRDAIAKTLVFFYPLAGRLREGPGRKLMVECTGEGILFIEADADVTLEQFGEPIKPPFPCMEELLFEIPGSDGIVNCPLLLVQITRLKCGGFIFTVRFNHCVLDAFGMVQFIIAVEEMPRGLDAPSVLPVWERHLLNASDPPKVTHRHLEYEHTASSTDDTREDVDLVQQSFFFGSREITSLRSLFPEGRLSTFEVLVACLWKCRTIALQLAPTEEVRMMCLIDVRHKFNPPILPKGYYGNGVFLPVVATTAGKLSKNPVGYALDLVKKAKAQFSEEYIRSVASLMVIKGKPRFNSTRTFAVSDIKNSGITNVDFGWGKASYGGNIRPGSEQFPGMSYITSHAKTNGEKGVVALLGLPAPAMERFVKELQIMLECKPINTDNASKPVKSSL